MNTRARIFTRCYTVEQSNAVVQCTVPAISPPSNNSFRRSRCGKAVRYEEAIATKQPPDLISHCSCCRYSICLLNNWQVTSKFQCVATPWHSRDSCRPNCAAPTTSTARYLLAMDVKCRQSNSNMSYFLHLHCASIFIELERAKWAHLWHLSIVNDGAAIERRHGHETTTVAI
jgi:hypothetical protein